MKFNPEIFRGFSIRGIVGTDFDTASMEIFGRGIGTWFHRRSAQTLITGYDVRNSSVDLHQALCRGLCTSGINVIDIGLTPTPMLNFAVGHFSADGGIMVTASHNTANYNGLKICSQRTVFGADLEEIYQIVAQNQFETGKGTWEKISPAKSYFQSLSERVRLHRPLHVVVDGGNGANGLFVPNFLRTLGCTVTEMNCEPDGNFPGRGPDPTKEGATKSLSQAVLDTHADLGIAFDGDGDRVVLVDETGTRVTGDLALMMLFDDALTHLDNKKIVYEVLCSKAVPDFITANGGVAIQAPSGYAYVHNLMLDHQAQVGGETSGHIFLIDEQFKFDDAILAAGKFLQILSSSGKTLSRLLPKYPQYYASPEYRPACPDNHKTEVVLALREVYAQKGLPLEEIDGVRVDFGDAWALIRQSNTQPALSLRFESKISQEHMERIKAEVRGQLKSEYLRRCIPWEEKFIQ